MRLSRCGKVWAHVCDELEAPPPRQRWSRLHTVPSKPGIDVERIKQELIEAKELHDECMGEHCHVN